MLKKRLIVATAMVALSASAAQAQIFGAPRSSAQRTQDRALAKLPECESPLGSIAIAEVDPTDYEALDLQPPQALLRLVVQRSGCFTLVDRGSAAMNALQRERALASSGELQRDSNMGGGQMRAADYILIAEVASDNANVSGANGGADVRAQGSQNGGERGRDEGRRRGGMLGNLAGGAANLALAGMGGGAAFGGGGIGGRFDSRTGEANTVLSLVNVRTTETAAVTQGYAAKRDVNWRVSGSAIFGGGSARGSASLGVGGYENTEMGRIITQAFIDAYASLVEEVSSHPRLAATADTAPVAEPAAPQATVQIVASPMQSSPTNGAAAINRPAAKALPMRVTQTTTLRDAPDGSVLRVVQNGQTVFPTGKAEGDWVEIIDDADEAGWVQVERLETVR